MGKRLAEIFRENSCYKVFFVTLLITGLSYGIYKGMIDNYLAEVVTMGELDRGIAEFFREIPGLLLVFILAVFYTFSAEKMYKIGAVVMLLGMGMLSIVTPTKLLVTLAIFVHSLGEHIQLGMKNTLSLNYAKPGKGGAALGHQNAVYQIGTLAGYLVVIGVFAVFAAFSYPMYGLSAVTSMSELCRLWCIFSLFAVMPTAQLLLNDTIASASRRAD